MLRPGLAASFRSITQPNSTRLLLTHASTELSLRSLTTIVPVKRNKVLLPGVQPCRYLTASSTLSSQLGLRSQEQDLKPPSTPHREHKPALDAEEPASDATEKLAAEYETPLDDIHTPSIVRPILFCLGFSALAFTGAAAYSVYDTDRVVTKLRSDQSFFNTIVGGVTRPEPGSKSKQFWGSSEESERVWGPGITEQHLITGKFGEMIMHQQQILDWCSHLVPADMTERWSQVRSSVQESLMRIGIQHNAVIPIVAVNTAVYLAWLVAKLRRGKRMVPFMHRHFAHRPSANRMRSMVTSMFSHEQFFHFYLNNLGLVLMGSSTLVLMLRRADGQEHLREGSWTPHYLAVFAYAGVFSMTVSHIATAIRFRRIASVSGLAKAKATMGRYMTHGALGSLYAMLAMTALAFPDKQAQIIFLPGIEFPIKWIGSGILAFDVAGILFGRLAIDHWAHLGGAAFGWLYFHYGIQMWEGLKVLLERMRAQQGQLEVVQ